MQTKSTSKLDLIQLKEIVLSNIEILLDHFNLEYSHVDDNIFMCCPAHDGSDNKNGCSISTRYKVWKCWTRGCHEHYGKDIFGFVKGVLQTDSFSEALKVICSLYNVDNIGIVVPKKEIENDLSKITNIFKKREHKINQCVINKVNTCGYSPYFESRGFERQTLKLFGVEDCQDKSSPMRYRSIIPIYFNQEQVGYIARSTMPWLQPKYLFSDGFSKKDFFYNYDRAIEVATDKHTLFLVEGQGDVWKMYEAGVTNCVGLFGKTITDEQKKILLTSGVTNLVILTDNDTAGRESKIKIKREFSRLFRLIFPKMKSKDIGAMLTSQIKDNILNSLRGLY